MNAVERLADRGEHAEAEHVDLEEAEVSMSSLSHGMTVRSVIVAGSMGATCDRAARPRGRSRRRESTGGAESPGCAAAMRRHLLHARIVCFVEADLAQALNRSTSSSLSHHVTIDAQPIDLLEREAEDLADLAQRALPAIADDLD